VLAAYSENEGSQAFFCIEAREANVLTKQDNQPSFPHALVVTDLHPAILLFA
jgi:hypothetical protein